MRKYPKTLADAAVMKEVLEFLYRQAEGAEDSAASYKKQMDEAEGPCSWIQECYAEHVAKAEAYVRMADRLAK